MTKMPQINGNVNHSPHVVILGAGASIAAYHNWGKLGKPLPSMNNMIDLLDLKDLIQKSSINVNNNNFESFYDDLSSTGKNPKLCRSIEKRVWEYFNRLVLPSRATLYDFLILSLREKDLIATFNWDPFLLQAYLRNERTCGERRPTILFLHGNVGMGYCESDRILGVNGQFCSSCRHPFKPSPLLYPVKQKNYQQDMAIQSQWDILQSYLKRAYMLTVFGYSAPKTDIEARNLMLEKWKENETFELAEVEIVDIQDKRAVRKNWEEFVFSHHSSVKKSIFKSYLFNYPRRSCDAFACATLMNEPWYDNKFPKFRSLEKLQGWIAPLLQEEELYIKTGKQFSGLPIIRDT